MSPELELMQTFGFSQHDLKANEQGKLSASQRNRYWKEGLEGWLLILIIAFAGCVIIGIAIDIGAALFLFLVIALGMLVFMGLLLLLFMGHVQAARGTITLSMLTPDDVSTYTNVTTPADAYYRLDLDQDSFYITSDAYRALKLYENVPCTLYYLSHRQRREILSIDIGKIKRKHGEG